MYTGERSRELVTIERERTQSRDQEPLPQGESEGKLCTCSDLFVDL